MKKKNNKTESHIRSLCVCILNVSHTGYSWVEEKKNAALFRSFEWNAIHTDRQSQNLENNGSFIVE